MEVYFATKSIKVTQRQFHRDFAGRNVPNKKAILIAFWINLGKMKVFKITIKVTVDALGLLELTITLTT